jgi:hypothetical protein
LPQLEERPFKRETNLIQVRALSRRLLLRSVPQSVLDSADCVLNFAGSFFIPALDFKHGVTGGLAYSFFHSAFGLLDRSLDAIFVPAIYPLFLRRPAASPLADVNAKTANLWRHPTVG